LGNIIFQTFDELSRVALDILAVPASTGTIEHVLSVAGDVSEEKRNRIKPKQLEIETMLRFNYETRV
jgi:hypothetical protein